MGLLDFFKNEDQAEVKKYSGLYDQLSQEYQQISEKDLVVLSCIAGLMARVAYVDFDLHDNEVKKMKELIQSWNQKLEFDHEITTDMAIKYVKEMAGIDNHLLVHPLKSYLNPDQRYQVLQMLFLIAASDGNVAGIESEEIRIITKGLELTNQHFLAARAEVSEFLLTR